MKRREGKVFRTSQKKRGALRSQPLHLGVDNKEEFPKQELDKCARSNFKESEKETCMRISDYYG